MHQVGKLIATVALAFMLTGCQPPTFRVMAELLPGGGLRFLGRDEGTWPFGWGMDEIYATNITVYAGEQPVWKIERTTPTAVAAPGCRTEDQHDPFPLRYGTQPGCWATTTAPGTLRRGVTYRVEADGSMRYGSGSFRLTSTGQLENVDYDGSVIE
jgi:hypothetical protein